MHSPTLSLSDPPTESPIIDSIAWIQGAVLGGIATTIAVIAVASIGLLMLSGRLELRRGITAVLGCFILFGSASIASALSGFADSDARPGAPLAQVPAPLSSQTRPAMPPPSIYDPYAGASVPTAR